MSGIIKKERQKQWLVLVLLSAVIFGFARMDYVGQPEMSRQSGFYGEPFLLEISADNASAIYYTLDGSDPDEDAIRYTGPISINDATPNPNNYSMRTDTSAGFYSDLIKEYKTKDKDPGYTAPDYPVDKCTVIRAVAVSPSGKTSDVISASFFVGLSAEDYNGCSIISLITDPDNLFDSKTGIYVTGEIFSGYMEQGAPSRNWRFWEGNHTQRGKDWERPVIAEFFDGSGNLILSQNCGVRTHGGVSRGTLPRSLKLYARLEYDKTESFGIPLFQGEYIPRSMILSSGGNQLITQFPDYMMTEMVRKRNYATMLFEPYVLFIDGEYWGFYWMSERYDEEYLSYYYDVQPDDVVMFKANELQVGVTEDYELYGNMWSFLSWNDMSQEENYKIACEMIDIESFADYYATMIYIARVEDWPGNNVALWRTRNKSEDSQYSDGKWRWMLFDCNSQCMQADLGLTDHDTLSYVIERDEVFASLWKNKNFREKMEERILQIGETCFPAEKMDAFIQNYKEQMIPILEKSWARFYGRDNDKINEFYQTMESHRIFFNKRYETVKSWFE